MKMSMGHFTQVVVEMGGGTGTRVSTPPVGVITPTLLPQWGTLHLTTSLKGEITREAALDMEQRQGAAAAWLTISKAPHLVVTSFIIHPHHPFRSTHPLLTLIQFRTRLFNTGIKISILINF